MTQSHFRHHAGVFERINIFTGAHVECAAARQRIQYGLLFVPDHEVCLVTLSCGCGVTVSHLAREAVGREIAVMTRRHKMKVSERVGSWSEARAVLGLNRERRSQNPARLEFALSNDGERQSRREK